MPIRAYKKFLIKNHIYLHFFVHKTLTRNAIYKCFKRNTFNSRWMPENFSWIALPVLPGGVTKDFQKFYQLSWIILSIFIEIQPNFNAKWALYSIIDGTNLAEFEVGEGYFTMDKSVLWRRKIHRNWDDYWNRVSWEPLGRFLSNLTRKVMRL